MEFSDEDLKRAAASLAADRVRRASGHPEVEALVAYHAGDLADERTEEIREHLVTCTRCGDLVIELSRVEEEERRPWTRFTEWVVGLMDPLRATASGHASVAVPAGGGTLVMRRSALAGIAALVLFLPAAFIAYYAGRTTPGVPLGAYDMTLRGANKVMRGAGEETPMESYTFERGRVFDLNLYPMEAVHGRIEVAAFRVADGELERWEVPIETSEEGAVRIKGRVGTELVLPDGSSDVIVAVGRPRSIPSGDELQRRLASASSAQAEEWTARRLHVTVVEKGGTK